MDFYNYNKKLKIDDGGDGRAYHICENCGHKMYFSKRNPTAKEVWKWKKKSKCTSCGIKFFVTRGHYKK